MPKYSSENQILLLNWRKTIILQWGWGWTRVNVPPTHYSS